MRNPALQKYFLALSDEQKTSFAKACKTTVGQIQQVMYGHRKCNAVLAIDIERESKGAVRCDDLCPQADFDYLRQQATA